MAEGEVTAYVGDVIAAVAAETRHAARAAAALVEVEYEVLEPVTDPFASLADGAPELHEGGNVLSVSKVQRGDVDAALAGAAHVVTESAGAISGAEIAAAGARAGASPTACARSSRCGPRSSRTSSSRCWPKATS